MRVAAFGTITTLHRVVSPVATAPRKVFEPVTTGRTPRTGRPDRRRRSRRPRLYAATAGQRSAPAVDVHVRSAALWPRSYR